MNPFFFGSSVRPIFGAYDPPAGSPRDHGVVLCPPFGHEYLLAHPTFRLLARQLAAGGHHVLRLDYHGTGDSAGEFEDATSSDWLDDIDTAITELKDVAGIARVSLIGLRYGGTLAARVARDRHDIDRLVLWDPVVDGRAFLSELHVAPDTTDEIVDVRGFAMSREMYADVDGVTPDAYQASLPPTLLAVTTASAEPHRRLTVQLAEQGVDVSLQHAADWPAWGENTPGTLALPTATLQSIVQWLS